MRDVDNLARQLETKNIGLPRWGWVEPLAL